MIPTLARRGKLILATAITFLLVGAVHAAPPLVALGTVVTAAVMTAYIAFYPVAVMLRAHKIELSWWVPPGDQPGGALAADRPFSLHLALRNHGYRPLEVEQIEIFASSALEVPQSLSAAVPCGRQIELVGKTRARAAGYYVLHGAVLVMRDSLGLFDLRAYFPNPIAVKVFPREAALRGGRNVMRLRGAPQHERVGPNPIRRRGMAGELREIRDHSHGDPFNLIAWKATARQQRLMVRDLETEIVVTQQILVDIGGAMRTGHPGRTKLDYAIETAASVARNAIDRGDRVGLTTFDTRVYSQFRPGDGYHHYLCLIDRLLETSNIVDEDLTDLTHSELVATVAHYLAHQEAVDTRVRATPALDDPTWERIHPGPSGELYDLQALTAVVSKILQSVGSRVARSIAPTWWWSRVYVSADSDPRLVKLRLFCRLRGIQLPYLTCLEKGRRSAGLASALATARQSDRIDSLLLLSDLDGLLGAPDRVRDALTAASRGGARVIAIVPCGPDFLPSGKTDAGDRVARAFAQQDRAQVEAGARLLRSRGIPVVEASARDNPAILARRIARMRRSGARAA